VPRVSEEPEHPVWRVGEDVRALSHEPWFFHPPLLPPSVSAGFPSQIPSLRTWLLLGFCCIVRCAQMRLLLHRTLRADAPKMRP